MLLSDSAASCNSSFIDVMGPKVSLFLLIIRQIQRKVNNTEGNSKYDHLKPSHVRSYDTFKSICIALHAIPKLF